MALFQLAVSCYLFTLKEILKTKRHRVARSELSPPEPDVTVKEKGAKSCAEVSLISRP